MKWILGRKGAAAIAVLAMSGAAWVGVGGGTGAGAYARWSLLPCTITHGSALILQGMPGAGVDRESAYLGVPNVGDGDETCSWSTPVTPISTAVAVEAWVASSRGTNVTVSVYDTANKLIGTTPPPVADSSFQVVSALLPAGQTVGSVTMTVTDHTEGLFPNASVATRTSSAMVDLIRLVGGNKTPVWQDPF